MADQATTSRAKEAFMSVLNGAKPLETETFLELFSELEPVSIDFMISLWRAVSFGRTPAARTAAQPAPGPLPQREGLGMNNIYGKRFITRDDVEPVVCFADDGSLVGSADFGVARLRELSFRGTSSAGLVYDQRPWIDYFRKLDDNTLVAAIDIKGRPMGMGFFLVRD
jgi:hypothetical protein